jgi:hypothetical protein
MCIIKLGEFNIKGGKIPTNKKEQDKQDVRINRILVNTTFAKISNNSGENCV